MSNENKLLDRFRNNFMMLELTNMACSFPQYLQIYNETAQIRELLAELNPTQLPTKATSADDLMGARSKLKCYLEDLRTYYIQNLERGSIRNV